MAAVGKRTSVDFLSGRNLSNAINGPVYLPQSQTFGCTISLLSFELFVAQIRKDCLCHSTHYLLQIFLKLFGESPECRRKHFFSFTETLTEYSIIADKDLLKVLIPNIKGSKVEVTECKWRSLVVEVGALGSLTGISNIASTVIAPLADWGVSVFCLSTNLDDYVMVKESDLEKALTCLCRRFKVVCSTDSEQDLSLVKSVMMQQASIDSPIRKQSIHRCPSLEGLPRPLIHPYSCSESHYVVCGVNPGALASIGTTLLDLMLFNRQSPSDEGFLSFSVVEEDVSLVVGSDHIHRFPEGSLYINKDTWRLIRIGEGPLGFDECGIVAQVASPLAKADISSYYICTFSTDHTLVPEGSVGQALQLLNERYVCKLINKLSKNGVMVNGHGTTQSVIEPLPHNTTQNS